VKGHIEEGESKEQAAVRELQEETGITQVELDTAFEDSFSYFFKSPQGELIHKTVYFLIGSTGEEKVCLSHEHIGFSWLPFKEALEQLTYQNARKLLEKAHKHVNSR
jgi:bis(5'-nucleosidyl)-tetraphosphatase